MTEPCKACGAHLTRARSVRGAPVALDEDSTGGMVLGGELMIELLAHQLEALSADVKRYRSHVCSK